MLWKNEYYEGWRRRFAWFPVQLKGGLTIWLEPFEERYIPHNDETSIVGHWDRRQVKES